MTLFRQCLIDRGGIHVQAKRYIFNAEDSKFNFFFHLKYLVQLKANQHNCGIGPAPEAGPGRLPVFAGGDSRLRTLLYYRKPSRKSKRGLPRF